VGAGDQHAVEVVAAWVPPVLGSLAALAAMGPVRSAYSAAAGWVTGWLMLTPRAHVFLSEPGQVDHHVAVGLFAAVLVMAAMRLATPIGPATRRRDAALAGAAAAVAILLWAGALLHVVIVQAFLSAQLLASRERREARARAAQLIWMHGVAALVLAPYCLGRSWEQFGAFSPEVHSNLQPLWFAAGAAALATTRWLWANPALGARRWVRVATALGVVPPAMLAAWWALPGLGGSIESASGWFTDDPFLARIAEIKPLLFAGDRFAPALAHDSFSYLFWSYPVLLAFLLWHALRAGRADRLLLIVVSTAFMAAALLQRRFLDVAVFSYAWVLGPAIAEAFAAAERRWHPPRWLKVGAAACIAVAALLPAAFAHRAELVQSLASRRGAELVLHPIVRDQLLVRRVADWLKRETPETEGYLDASLRPEYGVLISWDAGHLLRYYGERPLVQDSFGPWGGRSGFDAARRYYEAEDEAEAVAIADGLGARYVVASPKGSGQVKPSLASMARRLVLVRREGGALGFYGAALSHHRLVYLTDDSDLKRAPGRPPRRVAVYEIVPGARVVGVAPAGESVRFELMLRLPGQEPIFYAASARADASGRYDVRLPYPADPGYVARLGPERRVLAVSEADVREGRTLEGPRFEPWETNAPGAARIRRASPGTGSAL
jgi:asparagine N-glycosylation enzyme membrane subunit Stt3